MNTMNKNAKIFIAGAAGMVGSAIARKLLSLGYTNLLGTYHSRMPDRNIFLESDNNKKLLECLRLVQLDLGSQADVETFFDTEKPSYVFLAAAKVGGIYANNTFPAQFIHDNLVIQTNIIHAAYKSCVDRLLFLGSSCIYPKLCPQPMKEEHLLTGLLEPTNEPYAIAKIAGIKMCESYNRQYGTRFLAVMPTNLYGTNDNFDLQNSHVLPALLRKFHLAKLAQEGNIKGLKKDEARFGPIPDDLKQSLHSALSTQHSVVNIWGTGAPRREFLHVDDMADACVFVMNLDDKTILEHLLNYPKPCFVNVGTGTDCKISELVEIIQKVVGFTGEFDFNNSKPDGTPQKLLYVASVVKLGWKSSVSLTEGIKKTYEWYLLQSPSNHLIT